MRFLPLLGVLFLAACSPNPTVTTTRHIVVLPQESLYSCEIVKTFPDSRTLTDLQVARLLVELHQNNVRCRNSIESIRKFLEDSRAQVEEGREPQSVPPLELTSEGTPRRRPIR